jgi:hypothetical protein
MDKVTRLLLAALVLVLALLACRPFLASEAAPPLPLNYNHIKFLGAFGTGIGANALLMDSRNGDIWSYDLTQGHAIYVGKLTTLGSALVRPQ